MSKVHVSPLPLQISELEIRAALSLADSTAVSLRDRFGFLVFPDLAAARAFKARAPVVDFGAGAVSLTITDPESCTDIAPAPRSDSDIDMAAFEHHVTGILRLLGEDPSRAGLAKTPARVAKALLFLTRGYVQRPLAVLNDAVFAEDHEELVLVKNIEIFSQCEHHMVPFFGRVHIGYIPHKTVVGLSKLARLAEIYSRRLQVQERLTRQIALSIMDSVEPRGVAVVVEARHMCMSMRGVEKPSASTTTSVMLGVFRESQSTREEFLSLIAK